MTARLMTGTELAKDIIDRSAQRARSLLQETGVRPCLATVLVGDDPGAVTYVAMKRSRCAKAGIDSRHVPLPATTTTAELVAAIRALSADPTVHGILLQHPVPAHIDERAAFEAIDPANDVDGVTIGGRPSRPGTPEATAKCKVALWHLSVSARSGLK